MLIFVCTVIIFFLTINAGLWVGTERSVRVVQRNIVQTAKVLEDFSEATRDAIRGISEDVTELEGQMTEVQDKIENLNQRMRELGEYFAKVKEIRTWVQA